MSRTLISFQELRTITRLGFKEQLFNQADTTDIIYSIRSKHKILTLGILNDRERKNE